MLGRVLGQHEDVVLVTKAHPSQPGGLSPEGIRQQLSASLEAMGVPRVGVFYLHQPDTEHPLDDSLRCVHDLVSEGLIARVGLSNFSAQETERAVEICRENSLTLPTVYQGLYNALNRRVEAELFPILRANSIEFVAYNPLAAGMLTGKHRGGGADSVATGRFKDNKNYLDRFYKPDHFEAVELISAACDASGVAMVDAAYRWLIRHSALADGDGVLLGASSVEHLEANLAACSDEACAQPLPDPVLEAMDAAWELCRADAFAFWRGHSADMPGREDLDPGASYAVKK